MRLGFTGTRDGMTQAQWDAVANFVIENASNIVEVHHGDCIGADAQFDEIVLQFLDIWRDIHPPTHPKHRAFCQTAKARVHMEKDYHTRNRDIVLSSDWLIACPKDMEGLGGTWYTITWARKMKRDRYKPNLNILIITPEGEEQVDA